MATLSELATVLLTLGVALVAAGAALTGHWLARGEATRAAKRWRRERTFDLLDKAITRALSDDQRTARVGIAQLRALGNSELLQVEDQELIDTVLDAVLAGTMEGEPPVRVVVEEP